MSETDHPPKNTADRRAAQREREAVDAAVSERILDGSLRDAHAEVDMDPEVPDAAEQHREHAALAESQDGPAANETLGTTESEHPRSKRVSDRSS